MNENAQNRGGRERAQAGLIKAIVLIVIALIVLGFFGYSIKDILDAPTVKENLATVWSWIVAGWNWLVDLIKGLLAKIPT